MTFSEQFKDIFNMLCEKIGVAIDWTQENIVPYVMELCKRFVILNIVEEALWLVSGIAAIVVIGLLFKAILKDYRKCADTRKDTFWWEEFCSDVSPKIGTIFVFVFGGIALLFGLITIPCSISELLRWAIVPEVQLIKEITSFISAM
jgi:hypothetical protein